MPVLDNDPLEMVMNIEETFHITIPDSDAEQIRTVGQLYAYVLAKLPQPPCSSCVSSATFYRLRRALQELFAVPRERIRPAARLEDLVPREGRPERWQRLAEAMRPARLPYLQRPRWMEPWLPPCGLLALFTMMLTLGCILLAHGLGYSEGVVFAISFLGTLLCLFMDLVVNVALYRFTARYALDFPPGCLTIRDIVYTVLQSEPDRIVSATARASDVEIWKMLCSIVGRCFEVPSETLTPDRSFLQLRSGGRAAC
jgi:hypothetical protein